MTAEWVEPITAAIQRAFPDFQHEVRVSSDSIEADIYCPNEVFQSDVPSITMTIHDDEIYVNTLASCPDPRLNKGMRGTEVLTRIIQLGKDLKVLGVQHIRLRDASSIAFPNLPCHVSLAGYMILTSKAHHSWYNSHGFKSKDYEEEVKANTAFSQQPMEVLLRLIHRHRVNKKKDPLLRFMRGEPKNTNKNDGNKDSGHPDRLIQELLEVYQGQVTPDMPIQEGIRRIHQMAQRATSCKRPVITFYLDAMKAAMDYGILYHTHLVYPLS